MRPTPRAGNYRITEIMDPSAARRKEPAALRALRLGHWAMTGSAKRRVGAPGTRGDRSNRPLREYLRTFEGDIINVSGWEDRDKEGGFYRDYFGSRSRYVVSNIRGVTGMPERCPMASNGSSWISTNRSGRTPRSLRCRLLTQRGRAVFDPRDVRDNGTALPGRRRKRRPVRAGRPLHSLVRRLRPADAAVLEAVLRGARLHPAVLHLERSAIPSRLHALHRVAAPRTPSSVVSGRAARVRAAIDRRAVG